MLKVRELYRAFESAEKAFINRFHRLPTAEDPVFFHPDMDTPVMMEPVMLCNYLGEIAERTGASGAEVYAYMKMDRQDAGEQTTRNFEEAVSEAYRIIFAAREKTGGNGPRTPGPRLLKPRTKKL